MKKSELYFGLALIPLDYAMLLLGAFIAFWLRQNNFFGLLMDAGTVEPETFTITVLITSLLALVVFGLARLYRLKSKRSNRRELSRVFMAVSAAAMLFIVYIFFRKEIFETSRFLVLATWFFSMFTVALARLFIFWLQKALFKKGIGVHRVVIIGDNPQARRLEMLLTKYKHYGYQVVGRITSQDGERIIQQLDEIQKKMRIEELYLMEQTLDLEDLQMVTEYVQRYGIAYKLSPNILETRSSRLWMDMVAGVPVVEVRQTPLVGWGKINKRILDIIGALFLIIITSPIMLAVALAIKLTSRGPVFYKNERVGIKGELFDTYKFRTMKTEFCVWNENQDKEKALEIEKKLIAEKSKREGAVYKILDDPRRTKVGVFCTKTSLDELPQFFNVLKGDMSLVGPRPHQQREVEKYKEKYKRLLTIKPGITGMAQVSGRSDLDFDEEAKLDIFYIENWSIGLDYAILLKTPLVILFNRHSV
ncbi:sugar transferase [Patescibacteria group bacterium]